MVFVNFHLERFRRILCTVDCGMLNCSELVLFPTVTFHVTGNFPFTNATSLFEQLRYTTLMGIFVGGSVPKFIQNILCTVIILYGLWYYRSAHPDLCTCDAGFHNCSFSTAGDKDLETQLVWFQNVIILPTWIHLVFIPVFSVCEHYYVKYVFSSFFSPSILLKFIVVLLF